MPTNETEGTTIAGLRDLGPLEFGAAATTEGREWMSRLPEDVSDFSARWGLETDGERIWHGFHAIVVPVRRKGRALVLKLAWPPGPARSEALALGIWNGRGAVRLIESDPERGALLLERLDPSRCLEGLAPLEAAAVAGRVIRTLAVEAPPSIPSLRSAARAIAEGLRSKRSRPGRGIPAGWIEAAAELADGLTASTAGLMVHADLHYANVLAGEREPWAAVDPKPYRGDPERSVAELLWTRADELKGAAGILAVLDVIVDAAGLDRERAAIWGFVRAIDYWVWGLDNGLTEDPVRCNRVAAALAARI
ncbi:MAG TPA: aminoglycoside phosphotransferase family protein [Candidatus Dormibacteraeota bacterium]|nr:aminoglycoside phosphotransferase family protein [Candidatus Dormibacteraeota bacterium]